MKPEQKAKDLLTKVEKFAHADWDETNGFKKTDASKNLALIIVDETIEALGAFGYTGAFYDDFETGAMYHIDDKDPVEYWKKVRNWIEAS
jgi:hypothetical protein